MGEKLGKIHFWTSLVFMNGIFMPMFLLGMAGIDRRWYDGGASYDFARPILHWNAHMSHSAWLLGLAQIPFIINFFWSIKHGKKASDNPWEATTLEWTTTSPPPHGNFATLPVVRRGPYEYSVPSQPKDFMMQDEPGPERDSHLHSH